MSETTTGTTTDPSTPPVAGGAPLTSSIDLLIRHLELAKQVAAAPAETAEGVDAEYVTPDMICTLFYAASGTLCPLLYVHGS